MHPNADLAGPCGAGVGQIDELQAIEAGLGVGLDGLHAVAPSRRGVDHWSAVPAAATSSTAPR